MRFPSLRRTLRRIVLAGLPFAALGAAACQCPDPIEDTVIMRSPDAALAALLDRCRASSTDCEPICRELVNRYQGAGQGEYVYFTTCELVDVQGEEAIHYEYAAECVGGRRPGGYCAPAGASAHSIAGGWFAVQARLEAASVRAFLELANELEAHGAPAGLQSATRRAARDEVTHAALCAGLAHRWGARPAPLDAGHAAPRSLEQLATDNAVEGCVRETFGALVATWQARTAADPVVRAAMEIIAADETRHAALSWAIDRWVDSRLDDAARARVATTRRHAVAELVASTATDVPAQLIRIAGLPDATTTRSLLAAATAQLW